MTSLLAAAACADLDRVEPGVCGNLVVDVGEQCDGQDTCGTSGAAACRFTCEPGVRACPGELACAVDGVCVASTGGFVPYEVARTYELPADRLVAGDLDGDGRDDVIGVGQSLRVRFGDPGAPLLASYEKRIRPPTGAAAFGQLDGRAGLDVVFPTADGVFALVARGRELDAVPYASAQVMPDDDARACTPSPGWASCRTADLNGDGRLDRVGFVRDRDNLELELARTGLPSVALTLDTLDAITDLTTGDLDGDGFGDIAYTTRSVDGDADAGVAVVYGAPQAEQFVRAELAAGPGLVGVAAADLDSPPDGLDDLAVERLRGDGRAVAVYRGDGARDLSAPFRLDGGRGDLDVPYAVVAGEFVGGVGSGIDVMAYARNPVDADRTFFWWLRGLGEAQLEIGAVDPVDRNALDFLDAQWRVADLIPDPTTGNGPDEVLGLSPRAPACAGPALTAAVPSARFTATELLRSACLAVEGPGWQPALVGVVSGASASRVVAVARRAQSWWLGEADQLDEVTSTRRLGGQLAAIDGDCRDAQLWAQTPEAGTFLSWVCDRGTDAVVLGWSQRPGQAPVVRELATVPRGATHVVGDYNGDGLTDLALREGRALSVLLQCSADMVGTTPGC